MSMTIKGKKRMTFTAIERDVGDAGKQLADKVKTLALAEGLTNEEALIRVSAFTLSAS